MVIDTKLAMPVLIFVSVWKLIGYNVVLFLTGFSTINQNLYEAAKIDGASSFQTFKNITLPLLKPTTYFVTVVTAISCFQVFDLIYVMTGGGPAKQTYVLSLYMFDKAFKGAADYPMANTISTIMVTISLILIAIVKTLEAKFGAKEE